jgi:arylsulfatase
VLSYEYNLFEIMRTHIKAKDKLPAGKAKIEVQTTYVERRPAGPLKVVLKVNGKDVASGVVPVSAPLIFYGQRLPRLRHRPRLSSRA